jgi:hypothetical protein
LSKFLPSGDFAAVFCHSYVFYHWKSIYTIVHFCVSLNISDYNVSRKCKGNTMSK